MMALSFMPISIRSSPELHRAKPAARFYSFVDGSYVGRQIRGLGITFVATRTIVTDSIVNVMNMRSQRLFRTENSVAKRTRRRRLRLFVMRFLNVLSQSRLTRKRARALSTWKLPGKLVGLDVVFHVFEEFMAIFALARDQRRWLRFRMFPGLVHAESTRGTIGSFAVSFGANECQRTRFLGVRSVYVVVE